MDTKAWLTRARTIEMEVRALMRARRRAYELATSAVGRYGGTPVKTSGGERPVERLAELDEQIDREIDRLADVKREILGVIGRVENGTLRALLIERYINCQTWEEIAVRMNYTYRHITRMHGEALQEVERNMSLNVPIRG